MSKWTEIRNDFIEVEDDVVIVSIDAWIDDDDNSEGTVIAKVYGSDKSDIKVEYIDEFAKVDNYAQEIIKESYDIVREELERL